MQQLNQDEYTKRATVLLQKPRVVLIKPKKLIEICATNFGLRQIEQDKAKIEKKHRRTADIQQKDPDAYKRLRNNAPIADTGLALLQKEDGPISLGDFIWTLGDSGYAFDAQGSHYFYTEHAETKTVLQFVLSDAPDQQVIPPSMLKMLDFLVDVSVFNMNVWVNEENDRTRRDTVNCVVADRPVRPKRQLVRDRSALNVPEPYRPWTDNTQKYLYRLDPLDCR